ncbi:MAG: aminoglycoside phosphotransferase family protein [Anaerolineales bacterium]|jgi:hypothetical protein|nr:aminoglycoside phosphotransferase family protein [Anaerolineales bacterium]
MKISAHFWLTLGFLIVTGLLFAACAPAAMAPEAQDITQQVVKTVEVIEEVEEIVATEAPAAEEPAAPAEPSEGPQPTSPSPMPPMPTAVQEGGTVEGRVVELEWPERLRLGDSDVVRLSLAPSQEGYTVTTEFQEHTTITQTLQVQRQAGYELYAAARLDSVGFSVAPEAEQERFLAPGETITWYWSLQPRQPGQQRLSVLLLLRWEPLAGTANSPREMVGYARALDIQVTSFFGLTRGQAMTGGFLGFLFGGGMALLGTVTLFGKAPAVLKAVAPNLALLIEPRAGMALSKDETALLRSLFYSYGRLVLESEFLSGYSGARTFLAQPIRTDGRADAYTIIKIGEQESILREFQNYEQFVKDRLPPVTARIQHAPVVVRGGDASGRAALQYTFIGAPGTSPLSLRQALLSQPDPALLHKLFETFGPNWWMQRRPYTFRVGMEYDLVLPTHYVIEPDSGRGFPLDGRTPPGALALNEGDLVTLRGFVRQERRADGRSLSLLGAAQPGQPALRVRWLGLQDPNNAVGRVTATRYSLLSSLTQGMDLLGLPDPLLRLPGWLAESLSATQSTIHGDLNLENVLVGPGGFVWLIDFAITREGHTLFDFAHLGAEMVAHLAAPQMAQPSEYLAFLQALFAEGAPGFPLLPLFQALQQAAGSCLFNPSQPREFHLALALACLGALKFNNLDAHQKHLLYLTAAFLGESKI